MTDIPIQLVDDAPLGMFSLNSLGGVWNFSAVLSYPPATTKVVKVSICSPLIIASPQL